MKEMSVLKYLIFKDFFFRAKNLQNSQGSYIRYSSGKRYSVSGWFRPADI